MIILQADNRSLTNSMPFSTCNLNLSSGITSFVVGDVSGLTAGKAILGNWGSESSEVVTISGVTPSTNTVSLSAATKKAHSESTRLTMLKYDQVKFYWTATDTFNALNLLSTVDVDATGLFTTYTDLVHSTGYGWFSFYNSISVISTSNSNPIPYANFAYSTVKRIIDAVYSRLNQVQGKTISFDDAIYALNEGYSKLRSHLNLVEMDFSASDISTLNVVSGTKEYLLPDRFADLIYVSNPLNNNKDLEWIAVGDIGNNDQLTFSPLSLRYYIRGNLIGFSPTPVMDFTVNYRYSKLPTWLSSYYDSVDVPDDNFWPLIDYMRYCFADKLNIDPTNAYKKWTDGIDLMKMSSIKRSANHDSWSRDQYAIV